MILLIISIILFAVYSFLILYYWRAWLAMPAFETSSSMPVTRVSVIIPARNEESTIGDLMQAIKLQTYPEALHEVIVIDDHSEDGTAEKIRRSGAAKLISLDREETNSYKKKAIETGIAAASGDWIITTDADCLPGINWIKTIAAFKEEKDAAAVAGPVSINCNNSVLEIFQSLDMMVLQGITGGALYRDKLTMCNGANFSYDRKAFREINGFEGIDGIASGDDMLLLYKLRMKNPGKIFFLKSKSAIVATEPMKTWKEFINQRIRWASKAGKYQDKRLFPVLLLVYLFNLLFAVVLVFAFFDSRYWWLLLGLFIGKTFIELPFFVTLSRFFDKSWAIRVFPFFQPLHILYTIVTGFLGQFGSYEWKGRRVK